MGGGVGGGGAVYAKVYACIIRRKLLAKFFLRFGYFALTHKNFSKILKHCNLYYTNTKWSVYGSDLFVFLKLLRLGVELGKDNNP